MPDMSGPVATGRDSRYTLTIDDVADRYAHAGHPRTPRTVQRYCASGHLDAIKGSTLLGDKYFIDPESVSRHISQIEELVALQTRPSGLDTSRHDATPKPAPLVDDSARQGATVSPPVTVAATTENVAKPEPDQTRHVATAPTSDADTSRQDATDSAHVSRHVALLEREVERLVEDKQFLREQVRTKDQQIAALLERDKETNFLVQGLQKMLSPLLGYGRRAEPEEPPRPTM